MHNAQKRRTKNATRSKTFGSRIWNIVCWPFKMLARLWRWICEIELVGLINTTLLIAIIVMCSMLIIDLVQSRHPRVIVVPKHQSTQIKTPRNTVLPIKRDTNGNLASGRINVVPATGNPTSQVAVNNGTMYGDVIIESRNDATLLRTGTTIKGNLFLQNMHKYVLPCDIQIDGNLFLRDLNRLEFCGKFTITGNIYVNPRSSFGPVPGNARLGGQVIL